MIRRFLSLIALLIACAAPLAALDPAWTTPEPPFRIAGNLYYVGSQDLASYLIATPQGLILINSNLASSPAQIRASVRKLGFHWSDIKILLISHAHYDHCAGSAQILRETHAKYEVMAQDVSVVQSGGRTDFNYGADKTMRFPPAHVDRALYDGDKVTLGGVTLTAHLTAGHTRGTTTWTFDEQEGGRTLHVVIVGSPNVNPGYKLVGNRVYPQIARDYAHEFDVLEHLPCDIFLGAHGGYFDLDTKYAHFQHGDKDAFIDPAGYKAYVADRRAAFEAELARQSHPQGKPNPGL
ncbi:MAG TPA: subclass B3 metallo-beta-lactamase [Terracidiphilus sp.]|nr:subclass B3 metallo-beta-lactamase [Terracidiphilus sp.]